MPGTVMTLRQPSSLFANVSISSVTGSILSSSCRQSPARSATTRTIRGERTSVRLARMSGSAWRRKRSPCRMMMPRSRRKPRDLIDYRGPFADEARPYPVQRLQIQLLVGLGWNKASGRPLHRLGYGLGISEIILMPLPKRLRIRRRHLLHVVTKRGKFASNIVGGQPCFDANETGRNVRKPRCDASACDLLSQHDAAARIQADHVKRVLAHIYSDSGRYLNRGRARHGAAPSPDKPPAHSECHQGQERGRSIPFASFQATRIIWSLSGAKWKWGCPDARSCQTRVTDPWRTSRSLIRSPRRRGAARHARNARALSKSHVSVKLVRNALAVCDVEGGTVCLRVTRGGEVAHRRDPSGPTTTTCLPKV